MSYDDPRLVDLYDDDNPDGPDHDFFRALADRLGAASILDLGCGTGMLTVSLARQGRRVVGVDPSPAMLTFARARTGADAVEWMHGDSSHAPLGPFDLALMTGNVAQHILDDAWHRTLRDLRARMPTGGVLAFESRNPGFREWEGWATPERTRRDTVHGPLIEWMDVAQVDERHIRFHAHVLFEASGDTVVQSMTLVFRSRAEIEADLRTAGFDVDVVRGGWRDEPLDDRSRVMVFVARAS